MLAAVAAIAVVVGVAVGVWWYLGHRVVVKPFPINPQDTISSWTFKGGYTGNQPLIDQTKADAAKLAGLLGKGQYDDYSLYNGIGNDDNLLGNGKAAYNAYNHAIALYPDNQGLAYANLGNLMSNMGAYYTAADAYAKAVQVEPTTLAYHVERLEFLTQKLPKNTDLIQAALKDASAQFGDTPAILAVEAQWLEGQGRYADAVKAWQVAFQLSPPDRQTSIQAQINRDKAKE